MGSGFLRLANRLPAASAARAAAPRAAATANAAARAAAFANTAADASRTAAITTANTARFIGTSAEAARRASAVATPTNASAGATRREFHSGLFSRAATTPTNTSPAQAAQLSYHGFDSAIYNLKLEIKAAVNGIHITYQKKHEQCELPFYFRCDSMKKDYQSLLAHNIKLTKKFSLDLEEIKSTSELLGLISEYKLTQLNEVLKPFAIKATGVSENDMAKITHWCKRNFFISLTNTDTDNIFEAHTQYAENALLRTAANGEAAVRALLAKAYETKDPVPPTNRRFVI